MLHCVNSMFEMFQSDIYMFCIMFINTVKPINYSEYGQPLKDTLTSTLVGYHRGKLGKCCDVLKTHDLDRLDKGLSWLS